MSVTLTLIGKTPRNSQYDLQQFTERYKCDATADLVLIDPSVPQIGDAHGTYTAMFVTERYVSESGESASALDLVYTGLLVAETFPPIQHNSSGDVASATTNTDADIFPSTVTNPATVQFYAITNEITYYSADPNDATVPDDPGTITDLITWDLGFGLQPGDCFDDLVAYLLTSAFTQGIIAPPPRIEEIVASQYYRLTKRKTRTLFPYSPPC